MSLGRGLLRFAQNVVSTSGQVADARGTSRLRTGAEILWSAAVYGTSTGNYTWFRMWEQPPTVRRTLLTQRDSHRLVRKYNSPRERRLFDNKVAFARRFAPYFGRQWLALQEASSNELREFLANQDRVIAKPRDGRFGSGIKVIAVAGRPIDDVVRELLDETSRFGIVEQFIVQHEDLSRIYDGAVAVVRLVTIAEGETVHCPAGAITFASGGHVSNLWQGGLYCMVEMDSGTIPAPAITMAGGVYQVHPASSESFEGLTVPFWKEAIDLVCRAGREIDSIRYVGWDVAITTTGPVIIEGNTVPGFTALQHPEFVKRNGGGIRPRFAPFLS